MSISTGLVIYDQEGRAYNSDEIDLILKEINARALGKTLVYVVVAEDGYIDGCYSSQEKADAAIGVLRNRWLESCPRDSPFAWRVEKQTIDLPQT